MMLQDFWDIAARYKYAFLLAAFFAGIGWLFTTNWLVLWLDAQIPFTVLIFWYAFVMAPLIFIFGRAHKGEDGWGHRQTLASMMIFLAFALATSPSSQYISDVTHKNASVVLQSKEDGVVYDVLTRSGIAAEGARVLTYMVLPVLLVLGAAVLYKPEFIQKVMQRN